MFADTANVVALRDIKQGEELFVSYIDDGFDQAARTRNKLLRELYGFTCQCQACLDNRTVSVGMANMDRDQLELIVRELGSKHMNLGLVALLNHRVALHITACCIDAAAAWFTILA